MAKAMKWLQTILCDGHYIDILSILTIFYGIDNVSNLLKNIRHMDSRVTPTSPPITTPDLSVVYVYWLIIIHFYNALTAFFYKHL